MNELRIDNFLSEAEAQLNHLQAGKLIADDKINLYIFGQQHQNLLKIVWEAFSIVPESQLDVFCVKGCQCNIQYGENAKIYQSKSSGKEEVDFSQMVNMLSQFDNTKSHLKFECITDSEIAKKFNLHIIISDNDYSDVDWNYVLKDADFIFFTLTATALLSMCERKILRSTLLPNMENDLGVLLTNNNMILSDEKERIDSSMAKVFGNYATSIFRFPEEDEENFVEYLRNMSDYMGELHERKNKRAKSIVLNELLREVDLKINILSSDNVQLDEVIELLNEKLQKLPDRKESAFRRVRMKYTSKLRIELAEAVSFFHQQFDNTLEKEIDSNDNIEELQSILPGYISSQWENEATLLNNRVQDFTESISIELKDYINDDITSYIEDGISDDFASYVFGLTKMYLKKRPDSIDSSMQVHNFDFETQKDNTNIKKYGVVASGVALVLMSHPIIGIAVAVLGSNKVAKESEKKFVTTSKQALLDASKKMCIDYHNELDLWIEQATKHIEKHLESCIGKCYQNVIDLMIEAVKNKKEDYLNHDDKIKKLYELKAAIEEGM